MRRMTSRPVPSGRPMSETRRSNAWPSAREKASATEPAAVTAQPRRVSRRDTTTRILMVLNQENPAHQGGLWIGGAPLEACGVSEEETVPSVIARVAPDFCPRLVAVNVAPVHFDKRPCDREPEAQAAEAAGDRPLPLLKVVEQAAAARRPRFRFHCRRIQAAAAPFHRCWN